MDEVGRRPGWRAGGSPLAGVLEPDTGAKSPHPHQPASCLNCGTELVGAYCHACGQEAHLHRTIGGFVHDLLHGALHFEGRMWRTLPMLALRPGQLTRRYIDGARKRFVSPMALFLFSMFLMFAVFQALGITAPTDLSVNSDAADELETAQQSAEEDLTVARAELAALPASDARRASLQERIAAAEEDLENLETASPIVIRRSEESGMTDDLTGIGWIDEGVVQKWRDHPDLMLYKLQANSYKFSWLLIPLSVPFVWLLFAWKRRFNAYDHAIFVTYSLSFMSLLFVTLSVLRAAGVSSNLLQAAAILVPAIHIYKQMRGTYALSRFSTIWRLVALIVMISIILVLFLQIQIVLGAF